MNNIRSFFNDATQDDSSSQKILILIGLAGLTALLIALIPWLGLFNYPFRLLITMVHELGHGLAALMTGGDFIRFEIQPNGSGLAFTRGGWRFIIIPAGYLGAALFGAVLILLGRSYRWSRVSMAVIGGGMLLLTLRYGVPTIFTASILSGLLTTISGLFLGAVFLWVALKATSPWIIFLLHLVAIQAGLTAFTDLVTVIGLATQFFNAPRNDAQSMAQLTLIPAIVWAVLWAIAALVLIGGAIWITWLAPAKQPATSPLPSAYPIKE